jgi:hypothetical protein
MEDLEASDLGTEAEMRSGLVHVNGESSSRKNDENEVHMHSMIRHHRSILNKSYRSHNRETTTDT